jgi:DNA-binding response OmpR family regulator
MTCAECDRLRAEVRPYLMRERIGLSPSESRILGLLYERSPRAVPPESLLAAAHQQDHARVRVPNLVRVHICRLRALMGKDILTCGGNYALTAKGKSILDELLA